MLAAFKTNTHTFDFLVCNPPYISKKEMAGLDKSVLLFEPHAALYGGMDGMDFYRDLAANTRKILKQGGRIYCEIGCDQGEAVGKIFSSENWGSVSIKNDLAGRSRVFKATLDS
jgi:release factor glutamine methyltransferase